MNLLKRVFRTMLNCMNVQRSLAFTRDKYRHGKYDIGEWTYGDPKIVDPGHGEKLTIGRFCSIGGNVTIILGAGHRLDWVTTYPMHAAIRGSLDMTNYVPLEKGDVTIGNDVWVGEGAMILGEVTIGDGAVIGARSVVTKDVAPYAIVAGNPARTIRMRFDDDIVEALLKIRWWDWTAEKIELHAAELCSGDLAGFIRKHGV